MRVRFAAGITAVVVSIVAISAEAPLLASGQCNEASLRGSYAFRVDGLVTDPVRSVAEPFAAVGKNTYDGKGGMSGDMVLSSNGHIVRSGYTGTYTVDSSCTGTKTATLENGLTVAFDFVIDSNGRGIQMIVTTIGGAQGHTVSGSARKMFNGSKH